jgi:hypothetical protein
MSGWMIAGSSAQAWVMRATASSAPFSPALSNPPARDIFRVQKSIATVTHERDDALNDELRPAAQPDLESVTPEEASAPVEDEFEGATPPGYDWPTHGGYLGCLMGVMAGVLLGGFLGANIFAAYYNVLDLPLAIYILLNVALFLVSLIGLGRLGWWLGRRYYRYYPQPAGPTWGESDESEETEATEAIAETDASASDSAPEIAAHGAPGTAAEPEASEQRPA